MAHSAPYNIKEGAKAMSLDNHLRELNSRHRKLDEVLQEGQRRPSADSLTLTKLKREKLKLKEEIQSLSASTLKH